MIRVLGVGDVVGRPGRRVLRHFLPTLRQERDVDFIVVNGENAASGSGITPKIYAELRDMGADVITMGDHAYRRRDALPLYEQEDHLLRPANWPSGAPGRGAGVFEGPRGIRIGVVHLQGRVFMNAQGDFFEAVDRDLRSMEGVSVRVVDMHAEATSEKIALSWYLDGRVSLLFGSHTHVPTADAQVRPQGTAYISDCGMTGPYDGVIGRDRHAVIKKMRTNVHTPFTVCEGDLHLGAVLADIDETTGRATSVEGLWLPLPSDSSATNQ